jgi:predicted component of type VI protein secretion system
MMTAGYRSRLPGQGDRAAASLTLLPDTRQIAVVAGWRDARMADTRRVFL